MGPSRGSLDLLTAPALEPVTAAEAKAHARVETAADDALIDTYIAGARQLVEHITGRALINQTWTLTLDQWPVGTDNDWWDGVREAPISFLDSSHVNIRKAPFQSVTSVVTLDEAGASTPWASSNYYVTKKHGFGHLVRKSGSAWPLIPIRTSGAIVITFLAGYGANAADVPIGLRQAIKDLVLHWYEARSAAEEVNLQEAPLKTRSLLSQFMVAR